MTQQIPTPIKMITGNVMVTIENNQYILRLDHATNRQLIDDMGTSTLPLPYTSYADPEIVRAHVQLRVAGTVRMAI